MAAPSPFPDPAPRPQRTRFSLALLEQICLQLRTRSISDSRAAIACGVYPETLRSWKRTHPEILGLLAAAGASRRPAPFPAHLTLPSANNLETLQPRRRGRPSNFTPALADALSSLILQSGVSDTRAALLLGFDANAISRWKNADRNLAARLHQARLAYAEADRAQREAALPPPIPSNSREARRQLARMFPADYGCPSRRAQALSSSKLSTPSPRSQAELGNALVPEA
jgi:hypothetical protein